MFWWLYEKSLITFYVRYNKLKQLKFIIVTNDLDAEQVRKKKNLWKLEPKLKM